MIWRTNYMVEQKKDEIDVLKKIESVSDYLNILQEIRVEYKDKNLTFFFRGSGNKEWKNIPSVYRTRNFIEKEKEIYYEMIARCPQYFTHCESTLEHLVMMQHYDVPTRLLDISENPLVALFFACSEQKEQRINEKTNKPYDFFYDGRVDVFNIPDKEIKQYNSDTGAMLANLAKIGHDFNFVLHKIVQTMEIALSVFSEGDYLFSEELFDRLPIGLDVFMEIARKLFEKEKKLKELAVGEEIEDSQLKALLEKLILADDIMINWLDEYLSSTDDNNLETKIQFIKAVIEQLKYYTFHFKKQYQKNNVLFRRYIHFIRQEKSYFEPDLIEIKDLESVICIKVKQDNPHIIRQNGAFFLFGIKEKWGNKLECASIPDKYYSKLEAKKVVCIIPAGKKTDILDELKYLSISNGHLFTDIDKVAIDVKSKYSNS